jgi:hypothetical protein
MNKLGTAAVLAGTVTKLFGTTLGYWCRYAQGYSCYGLGSAVASRANQNVSSFGGQGGGGVSTGASVMPYSIYKQQY